MSAAVFQRPPFLADGRVVARRELTMGGKTYRPGEGLSAEHCSELSERQIGAWWQQGLIDTPPPEPPQPAKHQHRR